MEYKIGLLCGAFSYVWLRILTQPSGLFDWYIPFVQRHITFRNPQKPLFKLDKVLTQCPNCMAGQLSMWIFIFTQPFTIDSFFSCVLVAILTPCFLEKILIKN